jgi:hypothetical protein
MRSGMVQALGDLIKSGNTDEGSAPSYTVPGFQVDNIYPIFKNYFNADAQKAFSIKAHGLIHQRDVVIITPGLGNLLKKLGLKSCENYGEGLRRREIDMVQFCGSRSDRANVYKSVEKVIAAINDLAARGYITASLMELGVLPLAAMDKPESDYVVLSYVALTQAGTAYMLQNMPKMFANEGQVPERFEDQ